jgi:uncharacterized membrane protein YkoI
MGPRTATSRYLPLLLVLACTDTAAQPQPDWSSLLAQPRLSLGEAIAKGLSTAGAGVPFKAELELDRGRLVYAIDIAQQTKTCCVVLDVVTGTVVEQELDDENRHDLVSACKVTLTDAIAAALRAAPGSKPLLAMMRLREGKPVVDVTVFAAAPQTLLVDGITGTVAGREDVIATPAPAFTDTFPLDDGDLVPTGRNPFFALIPGYTLVLAGKVGDVTEELTITVLDETRRIAGIETRVVEERATRDGALVEVSRNFCAISHKTNSVYYFGEEVDIYAAGKVVRHDGAWRAGEGGARHGLLMPGTLLLGSRYQQEHAPQVAMDRAEVRDLAATLTTPAGRFDGVLVIEESSPLERGTQRKFYARGVGLIRDGDLVLVRHTDK